MPLLDWLRGAGAGADRAGGDVYRGAAEERAGIEASFRRDAGSSGAERSFALPRRGAPWERRVSESMKERSAAKTPRRG